jgi:ankyrin repeat protein
MNAVKRRDAAKVKKFVRQGAKLDPADGDTALMQLCFTGLDPFNEKLADVLVSLGANVNATGNASAPDSGETALDVACANVSDDTLVPAVKWFLKHGANPDGHEDYRPILSIAMRRYGAVDQGYGAKAAELLIARGARVNVRNIDGDTPLLLACDVPSEDEPGQLCYAALAHVLIMHGADINVSNNDGLTPLIALAGVTDEWRPSALRVAKELVEHGTVLTTRDKQGRTALQLAKLNHFRQLAKYLGSAASRHDGKYPRDEQPTKHAAKQ